VKCMAKIIGRRIALSRGGQIQYVVAELAFRFICESPSELRVCNSYLNLLKTLIIADRGKLDLVGR
jgi:hypothetical protein